MGMQVGEESQGGLNHEINITPLADVMLVLLIVMLIAPLLQKGIEVILPEAANTVTKAENDEQTVVGVAADGSLYVGSVRVQPQDLVRALQESLDSRSASDVLIKADRTASYGDVMSVFDLLYLAKIETIGLVTEPKIRLTTERGYRQPAPGAAN